jgi:hypothetical protein
VAADGLIEINSKKRQLMVEAEAEGLTEAEQFYSLAA